MPFSFFSHQLSCDTLFHRKCSIADESVPKSLRGKYLAFSPEHTSAASGAGAAQEPRQLTAGQSHLAQLRAAGLNHIHLLPIYDFGSVPEREDEQLKVQVSSL